MCMPTRGADDVVAVDAPLGMTWKCMDVDAADADDDDDDADSADAL